ncbi:mu-type opioid receptor [Biomphalaria pfeifferi]|uniref:Mu-type opioid receptor n=1 Tax=Biomphalaria pfeifferi TaxID=112525 RepID=A0AAD8C2M8_BIOPF|nr:mu-type opioid receptor [Biomphalaria pfeifferi]
MSSGEYQKDFEVIVQSYFETSSIHQAWNQSEDDAAYPHDNGNYTAHRKFYDTVWDVQMYFIPLICFLGILGNLASVAVFLAGTMKKKSCIMYLTTKCISDTVFLAGLSIVWLDLIDIRWFHRQGVCQMVIFITYVSGFFSVWLVVLVTVENYIHICHPNAVTTFCTPGKARAALLVLGIFAIFCYNFPLWTTYSRTMVSRRQCLPIPEFSLFNEGLTYFDTIITLVLPSFLILLFMTAIFSSLIAAYWKNKKGRSSGQPGHVKHFCSSPYGRLTVMLTAVSITFITLHTPSHIIRLRLLLGQLLGRGPTMSQFLLQRLFELFYYINFALNSGIYLMFGKSFRGVFTKFFLCRPCCDKAARAESRDSESAQNVCEASSNANKLEEASREDKGRRVQENNHFSKTECIELKVQDEDS